MTMIILSNTLAARHITLLVSRQLRSAVEWCVISSCDSAKKFYCGSEAFRLTDLAYFASILRS